MNKSFSFVIPRANVDLLNSDGNKYFVKQLYNYNEIPNLLREAHAASKPSAVPEQRYFYLFDHFDTFYSVIETADIRHINSMMRAMEILQNTSRVFGEALDNYLKQKEFPDLSSYLNVTKMLLYLITSLVRAIDNVIKDDAVEVNQRKPSKKQAERANVAEWYDRRYKVLTLVLNLMQLPLEKLWVVSIAEEEFVNMICDLAYRTLDHPSIKDKRVNDVIFQIFGYAIKNYNHALSFPIRAIRIMTMQEMAVVPIANGILVLNDHFNITSIFGVIVRELIENLNMANSADQTIAKHCSLFLSTVADLSPKVVIPHLSMMGQELLNLESYSIRNCVLGIMGHVIIRELTSENLTEEQKEIRDEFLDDLLQHVDDVSGYVRSKVLQIWNEMQTEAAVPLTCQTKVVRAAVDRLEDKAALVRKNAVVLLRTFLETNPFAAKLSLEEVQTKYKEESEKLEVIRDKMLEQEKLREEMEKKFDAETVPELHPIIIRALENDMEEAQAALDPEGDHIAELRKHLNEGALSQAVKLVMRLDAVNREQRNAMSEEQQVAYLLVLLRTYLFDKHDEQFDVQNRLVEFYSDWLEFSKKIGEAVPKIEEYLMSKTNTDVIEAVDFFTTGYLFKVKDTSTGMRRMLSLVWTGDKEKRAAVTKAYHRVLFQTDFQGRAHSLKVVENLTTFLQETNGGEYYALETLTKEWVDDNTIDANIIQVFFERFTEKLPNTTPNMARIALQFLIMVSNTKHTVVTANKELIMSIGCGDRGARDPRVFGSCLQLLLNVAPPNPTDFYKRMEREEAAVDNVIRIFTKIFFYPKVESFEKIGTQTIAYIYRLCQSPDNIAADLMVSLCDKIKELFMKHTGDKENMPPPSQTSVTPEYVLIMPKYILARLIFLIGYVAMKELIFLDIDVYSNMKYREDLKKEKNDMKRKMNKRKSHLNSLNSSASDALKRLSSTTAEPQQEPDEMLVGATAEDSIAELINQICELELVNSPKGLMQQLVPIIERIMGHPGQYRDDYIQATSCLSLIRFMTVSSEFCNSRMPFLMNVMQKTTSRRVKRNIIIGLSDFTCRFPNVIEPWTGHLYNTLLEEDVEVRLTAVKMLSHLVLQEMIRVRGQLSDMAKCIVDTSDEICNVTKAFFKEIANKQNILYNVLPDIISRLSAPDAHIEEEKYHIIMKYIMGLIQKDRQIESLVDKLCLRFKTTSSERQWRDIAFCLSLLNHTEKTIRKLIDHIPSYRDKVQIDEVYDSFKAIISNSNKLAKPEMKVVVKEFEEKLQECLAVRENGEDDRLLQTDGDTATTSGRRDEGSQATKGKKGSKVQPKKKKPTARHDDSSDDSDFEFQEPIAPAPRSKLATARQAANRSTAERTYIETDSDEDSSPTSRRSTSKRRRR